MVIKRYTCKECTWRFVLDLENKEDTFGRPCNRREILFKHIVEDHGYKNIIESFVLAFRAYFKTEDP